MAFSAKEIKFLIVVAIVALCFYTFRITETFTMTSDTARDLVRILEIWQNKEITVIGPPLSLSLNTSKEIYFGSSHYYFGIAGLLLAGFQPYGTVIFNAIIFTLSIFFFYRLVQFFNADRFTVYFSTLVYALSPVTVAHSRTYWNPNLIIPLSTIFWTLALTGESKKGKSLLLFFAGIVAGIIFNLHYINIIPILIYTFFRIYKGGFKSIKHIYLGFAVTVVPLLLFEIKNGMFLTKALFENLGNISKTTTHSWNLLMGFDSFLYIFGLGPENFYMPGQINITFWIRALIHILLMFTLITLIKKRSIKLQPELLLTIFTGLVCAYVFATWNLVNWRYFLSVYPLLVVLISMVVNRNKIISILIILPLLTLSLKIITHQLVVDVDYLTVPKIEKIANIIRNDIDVKKYNVTENILGDARSLSFRYFLLKDSNVKPQSVIDYSNLDALYVVTTSKDRVYRENRWEFSVANLSRIEWQKEIDDVIVMKFSK